MNTRRCTLTLTLVLLVAVALAGCDQAAPLTETTPDAPAAAAKPAPASPYTLTGFATPESALYDPVADAYYVSNVGDPFSDGDGFVSRINPNAAGDVSSDPGFVWIDDLDSPFGMALDGNTLYVVDRDGLFVYEIDRATGDATETDFIALGTDGSLLNDVCVAGGGPESGPVYVTDTGLDLATSLGTGTDAIYEIDDGNVDVLIGGEQTQGPNGCLTNGANVYWTTFKANKVYRTNPSGRQFEVATLPTGGLDSVVRDGGTLYVSSWNADPADPANPTGAVYSMSMGGSRVSTVIGGVFTPGDLGFDTARDRVLVPSVFGNEVVVVPVR